YDITIAGKLIVEGDGIIKELHTHGTSTLMWDGHPGAYELAVPHIFVNSGTIAGGSSGGVRINVLGGNVAYNEDMQADYYGSQGSRTLKRITIDLGEYADIFTSDMLRISQEFSYNTTGLYPVDGKIYFWELVDKYLNVGEHASQLEFNHLEITDDYTYYVYPRRATDSAGNVIDRKYELYRLPERTVVYTVDDEPVFVAGADGFASGVVLNSFYYALEADIPAYSDPLYTEETTTTRLYVTEALQNGDYAEWYCKDAYDRSVTLGRSTDSLNLTADNLSLWYHDYRCVLYASDGTVKKTHNFVVYFLSYNDTATQYAAPGETVTFKAQYYADGTWLENYGFEWCWQWRTGSSASWNTVDDTDAYYDYTAFRESYENSSHGYQFRRMAYLFRINKKPIILASPAMMLNMSTHVTSAPETVEIQKNYPGESYNIEIKADRPGYITWLKKVGDNYVQISGANSLTLSFPKSEYTDENGKWDPDKVDGIYVCSMYDIGYGCSTSVEIEVKVVDHVFFTSDPKDKVTATGGIAEFNVGIGENPPFCGELWWEYSFDDGATWGKAKQWDDNESFIVKPSVFFASTETESGIVFQSYYNACKLTVNASGLDAEKILVRCAMNDGAVTYYTKTAAMTFVDMPVIEKQPQSLLVSYTQGTAYMEYSFADPLPEEYTVSYQWQYYNDQYELYEHWEDIVTSDKYTCGDRRLEFKLWNQQFTGKYRCKITFTDEQGFSVDVYTDEALLEIVHMPSIRNFNLNSSYIQVGDHVYVNARIENNCIYTEYKWQISKDGVNWEDPDDSFTLNHERYSTGFSMDFNVTKEMDDWKFRFSVTNEYKGVVNTAASELTMNVLTDECKSEYELRQAVVYANRRGYDTLTLTGDITLTSTLVLESNYLTDLTIDLNGHILQSNGGEFTMLEVQDGVKLTIIDSNSTKDNGPDIPFTGGSIRGAVGEIGGAVKLYSGATFNFNAGTIYNCTATRGGAVCMMLASKDTKFVMNGGAIYGCSASDGAAVYIGAGTNSFVMNAGTISGCTADFCGAAVYMQSPDNNSFVMNGGEISNCTANYGGAAVYLESGKHKFVMNDGKIVGCNQAIAGAASVDLMGGTIEDCTSVIYIGDDYLQATVILNGIAIRNCAYEKTGDVDYLAPIYVKGFLGIQNSEFTSCGNKSGNGGLIYLVDGYCGITGITFEDCYSQSGNGGAIYAEAGRLVLDGVTFKNCNALSGDGGAIYMKSGLIRLDKGCLIEDCTAAGNGSAIYSGATIQAVDGVIYGTVVAKGGIEKLNKADETEFTFFGDVTCDGEDATGDIKTGMYYGKVTGISEDEDVVAVYFCSDGEVYATFVLNKGECVKVPITPEDTRTFIGWYKGDIMYDFDASVNEDLTLTAMWVTSAESLKELENKLDEAKKALEEAIKDGDKALDEKIKNLNDALTAAKTALETADADNKTALENKIAEARDSLQSAINQVQQNLDEAKEELNKAIKDGDKALDEKIKNLN
ncbi:MAG: hypothetical protein ACI4SC_02920, partial [Candidatus Neoclostridium sp.]